MRYRAALIISVIALAPIGCDGPNAGVSATQPKPPGSPQSRTPDDAESTPSDVTPKPQRPASQPSSAAATTSQPTTDSKSNIDAENDRLPPYIKILEAGGPGPVRIDVTVDGSQRIVLKTTNVAKFRIARKDSPLATDRSVALRVDSMGFEWTRARQALILQRTATGDWLSEEEVEKQP